MNAAQVRAKARTAMERRAEEVENRLNGLEPEEQREGGEDDQEENGGAVPARRERNSWG